MWATGSTGLNTVVTFVNTSWEILKHKQILWFHMAAVSFLRPGVGGAVRGFWVFFMTITSWTQPLLFSPDLLIHLIPLGCVFKIMWLFKQHTIPCWSPIRCQLFCMYYLQIILIQRKYMFSSFLNIVILVTPLLLTALWKLSFGGFIFIYFLTLWHFWLISVVEIFHLLKV